MNKKHFALLALVLVVAGCATAAGLKGNIQDTYNKDPGVVGRTLTDLATFNWAGAGYEALKFVAGVATGAGVTHKVHKNKKKRADAVSAAATAAADVLAPTPAPVS